MSNSAVYINDKYSEPMAPQHTFANNFDLDHPDHAVSSYARIMHEHTKKQLTSATDSARRRSLESSDSTTTVSSVDSAASS